MINSITMNDPSADQIAIDQLTRVLRRARLDAGLSLRELAGRAGTSHSTLVAYEQGRKAPAITTYLRILGACGFAVDVSLSPRIRDVNGLARGEELREVLELADQFPVSAQQNLDYPRFGQS